MTGQFKAISISFKKAPLELREHIALNEGEVKALLMKIRDVYEISEALILSTCNRTEIYYLSSEDLSSGLLKLLAAEKGTLSSNLEPYCETFNNEAEAVRYLFEVGTGLHSQVVGDVQLPSQIKDAYQWCADMQMAGPFLHRLMHTVFFVNKRVFQETAFRDGAASTSYAAVETIESFLPLLKNPKILVLGLGEMGQDVVKTLHDKGYDNFTVSNRTLSKAEELSKTMDFEVVPFENILSEVHRFDIIISSVRAESPLLNLNLVNSFEHKSVKYFIDLSVPRSIDQAIEDVAGMVVYDLDEIQQKTNQALEARKAAIPHVSQIIDEALVDFNDWSNQMVVSPTIHKLKNALEQIRKDEMAKYMKSLTEEEAAKMEKITASMMQKIIKLPVLQLKAACKRGEAETLIDVLNDLFNLEKVEA
ncbi:glutamyl-tRNA reductase [Jiulongibacter sediminis]|uniref:Glutamyl-tRNA reductase n=1 Tax=Jiulongibacter sediminis TaxID=1605367 RepID=A0A0P7C3K9_9BACT|nr:glutamyl-tRNA reductase [Jiulongibacter sediminis]KPM48898.1 glutamyl-tRNA reductase [Jiulongibacter sediminis]TBX25427.1 glutamyl-tRNA reductase [Jiulongibacter sediminis]